MRSTLCLVQMNHQHASSPYIASKRVRANYFRSLYFYTDSSASGSVKEMVAAAVVTNLGYLIAWTTSGQWSPHIFGIGRIPYDWVIKNWQTLQPSGSLLSSIGHVSLRRKSEKLKSLTDRSAFWSMRPVCKFVLKYLISLLCDCVWDVFLPISR